MDSWITTPVMLHNKTPTCASLPGRRLRLLMRSRPLRPSRLWVNVVLVATSCVVDMARILDTRRKLETSIIYSGGIAVPAPHAGEIAPIWDTYIAMPSRPWPMLDISTPPETWLEPHG